EPLGVPPPLSAGLMWLEQREGGSSLRHTCEQSDGLSRYGWLMHDGESFGVQEIQDGALRLSTEFVKRPGGQHGGDWSWRVTARHEVRVTVPERPGRHRHRTAPSSASSFWQGPAPLLSLFFYVATDGQGMLQPHLENGTRLAAVTGTTEELGSFTLTFLRPTANGNEPTFASYNYLDAPSPGLHLLAELVRSHLSNRFVFSAPGRPRRRFFAVDATAAMPDVERVPGQHLLLH
ncbi:MOGS glucosidase, partial [Baryphthengus martii]|nr:MOGS glucosidase [Baryphthengus martii]